MRYVVSRSEQLFREDAFRVYVGDIIGRSMGASEAYLYSSVIEPEIHEEIDVDATIERVMAAVTEVEDEPTRP